MGEGNFGPEMGPIIPRSENEPKIQTPEEGVDKFPGMQEKLDGENIIAINSEEDVFLHEGEDGTWLIVSPWPDGAKEAMLAWTEAKEKNPNLRAIAISFTAGEKSRLCQTAMAFKSLIHGDFKSLGNLEEATGQKRAEDFYRSVEIQAVDGAIVFNLPDQGLAKNKETMEYILRNAVDIFKPTVVLGPAGKEAISLLETGEPHDDLQAAAEVTEKVCDENPDITLLQYLGKDLYEDETVLVKISKYAQELAKKANKGNLDLIISLRPAYRKLLKEQRLKSRDLELAKKSGASEEEIGKIRDKLKNFF